MSARSDAHPVNVGSTAGRIQRLRAPAVILSMLAIALVGPAMASEVPIGSAPASLSSNLRQVGADPSWWQTVTADLGRREYAASVTPAGLQAPNRAQNLRTTFGERGIEVMPRTGQGAAPAWRFAWETSGFGREDRVEPVAPASPQCEGTRIVYRRDGWSEWYENTSKGLEQGFTIKRRPGGAGPLRIAGKVPGALEPRARADGAVSFIDEHGACVIHYGGLHVSDARGNEVPSRLSLSDEELAILVDDRGAAYPLTVDPLMTSPAWTVESDQASAQFGRSVAAAGDVNGDGYSDVIVGAYLYDNGQADEGRAFVYHGSAAGLSTTPDWTAEGDQASAWFGFSVATAGDVNGDGYADVIIGAIGYDNGENDEGRAFVYHGSAAGLSTTAAWSAESDQAGAQFGRSAATAGDVNGDGYSDVIVGAHLYDNGQADEGRAFVCYGSPAGLATTATWTAESDQAGALFGRSVATAGDVNGDGYSDVIVGVSEYDNDQTDEGRALVYHGSAAGLGTTAVWIAESDQDFAWLGFSVATAGDVNGDGFSDVIVGAPFFDNGESDEGRTLVYYGSAAGLSTTPAWTAESDQAGAFFGASVGTAGDVNGDGFADVIVGAHLYDNGQTDEGRAFVYFSSLAGLVLTPTWTAEGDQPSSSFGLSVGTAGDVNGDGFSDVIVGTPTYGNGQTNEGGAFVYNASANGLSPSPNLSLAGDTDESIPARAACSESVGPAGDVNGDGFSDVIYGAPHWENGEWSEGRVFVHVAGRVSILEINQFAANFGTSVGTAGDVNGDGYSDVIAGAPGYADLGQPIGRALVYVGSAAGLALSPAWSVEDEYVRFGTSVGTAGDVNGDGYSDVIVGAPGDPLYENIGWAYVYLGSAAGLSLSPAWSAGGEFASQFGASVGTAGDVNGDGFSDVIVNGTGGVFVYLGSASGLSLSADWTGGTYGYSVGTAGDVNGDGFSDVIIGTGGGRALVYYGSPSGLGPSPAWTVEVEGCNFGWSVGTAGDVNGDGFSDVVVGAPLYSHPYFGNSLGRVFAYYGSAAGLSLSPSWDYTFPYFARGSRLGYSVGTAGDVNGDGFSDVIAGAPGWDPVDFEQRGRGFIFYGNHVPTGPYSGHRPARIPRQVRTDDVAPIALLGRSDSGSGFLLKAHGSTTAGRSKVRLQYEVKPFGTPFDGTGLSTGPWFDTGIPDEWTGSWVPLSDLATGLNPGTPYHWRLRILGDSPYFPRTPWLWSAGNAVTEADLRTAESTVGVDAGPGHSSASLIITASTPNPFARATDISYTLPRSGRVWFAIYDASGRQCAILVDGTRDAGVHRVRWDGRCTDGGRLPAGVYLARLVMGDQVVSRKLVLAP